MLARKRAAQLDDGAKHLFTGALHLVEHAGLAEVEHDVGMKVAVAGVKDVGDRKLVVLSDLADG